MSVSTPGSYILVPLRQARAVIQYILRQLDFRLNSCLIIGPSLHQPK